MESKNIVITIVVILVLLAGGYFIYQNMQKPTTIVNDNQQATASVTPTPEQTNSINAGVDVTVSQNHQITYTDAGYSPTTLTIKKGDTVTWKNESSGADWVGSAMHPTHVVYSGTTLQQHCPDTANDAFDECKADKPGESWSFTFNKVGTWGYHNHMNSKFFGKVVVE